MFKKLKTQELNRLSIEELQQTEKKPVVVILDNVRSLNNVGSIFRTSDGFRIEKIYLCGITGTPPDKDIHKTALGAENSVNWEYVSSSYELGKKLVNDGYHLIAVEQAEGSILLNDFKLDKNKKIGIIFGNEIEGVSEDLLQICHQCIEIPQFGNKHSFNVSVCAGIVLWELLK